MCGRSRYRIGFFCTLLCLGATALLAQEAKPGAEEAKPKLPEIADEPKTVDPKAFMPAPLAESVTVDFSDSSLREVLEWLRDKRKLVVLLDKDALSKIGVLPSDPISDRLDGAPIYLLLNRLRSLNLDWYYEDDILHITSREAAEDRDTTIPYHLGDLIDADYDLESIQDVLESTVAPNSWSSVGGAGAVSFLGDVMFVRQTDQLHREVRGLLAGLRSHGRRTFTFDPPQHAVLRQKLEENVTVAFRDTPLEDAVRDLAEKTKIDIRLDRPALQDIGVRERQPLTISLTDRKLRTVLQAMLIDLEMTWILRDGVLWISSPEVAEASPKTAVFDVRDLCRDEGESDSLIEAITSQASPTQWDEVGGPSSVQFARPGTMVLSATEDLLDEVLQLIEAYRLALRTSKPRVREEEDPNEVVTVYYRMHAKVAADLATLLPTLVRPDSWKSAAHADAPGEIFRSASSPEITNLHANVEENSAAQPVPQKLIMEQAVLIIRQTRAAHDEIRQVIWRVRSGDSPDFAGFGGMGGGGMGGGMGGGGFGGKSFGSGFFSVPGERASGESR